MFKEEKKIIHNSERILIDSCILMSPSSFQALIDNIGSELVAQKKKIEVPNYILRELCDKTECNKKTTAADAKHGMRMLHNNKHIFDIDFSSNEESENSFFADKYILSSLTQRKNICSQLLITNDIGLSKDVFALNRQSSCYGYPVQSCCVSIDGHLGTYSCISPLPTTESIGERERNLTAAVTHKGECKKTVQKAAIFTVGATVGVFAGIHLKSIYDIVKERAS